MWGLSASEKRKKEKRKEEKGKEKKRRESGRRKHSRPSVGSVGSTRSHRRHSRTGDEAVDEERTTEVFMSSVQSGLPAAFKEMQGALQDSVEATVEKGTEKVSEKVEGEVARLEKKQEVSEEARRRELDELRELVGRILQFVDELKRGSGRSACERCAAAVKGVGDEGVAEVSAQAQAQGPVERARRRKAHQDAWVLAWNKERSKAGVFPRNGGDDVCSFA